MNKVIFGRVVLLAENCASFILAYGIIDRGIWLYRNYAQFFSALRSVFGGTVTFQLWAFIFFFLGDCVFIVFSAIILLGFIVRRRLTHIAVGPRALLVPVLNLFLLQYGYKFIRFFPESMHFLLLPVKWIPILTFLGSLSVFFGFLLSTVALYQLRYSFSYLIEVRDVVSGGVYRFSRHPIYLGYMFICLGVCLAHPTFAYLIFYLFIFELFIWRAILEEKHMAAFSDAYRQYMAKTPFLFPFFRIKRYN